MRRVNATCRKQAVWCGTGNRVEVSSHEHGNLCARSNLLQSLEQRVNLPQLDVSSLGIGVDVCICDAEKAAAVAPSLLLGTTSSNSNAARRW